jgi:hypothetical protein
VPVGLGVACVVEQIGGAARQAERERDREGRGDRVEVERLAGEREPREHEGVLDPLLRPHRLEDQKRGGLAARARIGRANALGFALGLALGGVVVEQHQLGGCLVGGAVTAGHRWALVVSAPSCNKRNAGKERTARSPRRGSIYSAAT